MHSSSIILDCGTGNPWFHIHTCVFWLSESWLPMLIEYTSAWMKCASPRFSSCVAKGVSLAFSRTTNNYSFLYRRTVLGSGISLHIYMDMLNLNRATPPIPHNTIFSPCMLTPYKLLQSLLPATSLSAEWVSSPIISPMKLKSDIF